ncbi:MAG: ArsR/SmtB family transcription factor [Acidobacteriaceae bacterium]
MKVTDRDRHLDCVRMGDFFMIFAHATRMRIFCALQNGGKTVTRIAEEAEISVSNASQHLRLMRDRGAVTSERQGQTVFYKMADDRFFEAANMIRDALEDLRRSEEFEAPSCPSLEADHKINQSNDVAVAARFTNHS